MAAASHTIATAPTDQVPLTADQVPWTEIIDVATNLDNLANKFVSNYQRDWNGALRPGVPVVDM
jgi:hypothetical protein